MKWFQSARSLLLRLLKKQSLHFIAQSTNRPSSLIRGQITHFWKINKSIVHLEGTIHAQGSIDKMYFITCAKDGHIAKYEIVQDHHPTLTPSLSASVRLKSNHVSYCKIEVQSDDEIYTATLPSWQLRKSKDMGIARQYKVARQLKNIEKKNLVSLAIPNNTFSVVIPIFNPNIIHLKASIESVLNQNSIGGYELILTVDEMDVACDKLVHEYALLDSVKLNINPNRLHISENLNAGLKLASGDYCIVLDQDDLLDPNAFHLLYEIINARDPDVVYSDEDKIDELGVPILPVYKPGYSPIYLRSCNYINHLVAIKRSIGDRLGWFRKGYEGAQDFDLLLRLSRATPNIVHLPEILYHWRMSPGSTALNYSAKSYAEQNSIKAISDHLKEIGLPGEVTTGNHDGIFHWLAKNKNEKQIILLGYSPVRKKEELKRVSEFVATIKYSNWILFQLCDPKLELEFNSLFSKRDAVRFISAPDADNALENLLHAPSDELDAIVGFVDFHSRIGNDDWLTTMNSVLDLAEVGVAGSKHSDEKGALLHAGLVLGMGPSNVAGVFMSGMNDSHPGYFRKDTIREISACALNGLFLSHRVSDQLLNLDHRGSSESNIALELCHQVSNLGLSVVCNPLSHLILEDAGREGTYTPKPILTEENEHTKSPQDLYYNRNLSLDNERVSLSALDD